jgi:hypothetical protein
MNLSKKVLKISVAILMLSLLTTLGFAYHLWVTRQVTMTAIISTTLDFKLYNDSSLQYELTSIDWGEFGSGEKYKLFYFKNLGNDKGYFNWNLTGTNWTYITDFPPHYTDTTFNFTIYSGDEIEPNLGQVLYPNHYWELPYNTVGHAWMKCWTEGYLPASASWTLTFTFYDNLG